jgi:hypothetical protein
LKPEIWERHKAMNEQIKKPTIALTPTAPRALPANYADPFETHGRSGGGDITGELLRFVKGDYIAGREKAVLPIGMRVVANMDSFKKGLQCWIGKQLVDSQMGFVVDGFIPPRWEDLSHTDESQWEIDNYGNPRNPWQETETVELADPETGELFTFTTSSSGGLKATKKLCLDYARERHQHPDEWPVIELNVKIWKSSKHGPMKDPAFPIVGWVAKDGPVAPPTPAPAPAPTALVSPLPADVKAVPSARPALAEEAPALTEEMNDEIPF